MAGRRIKAVIFDMDGVIVDSMPYHYLAWYESLRPLGVRVSCFDVYRKEGERWDRSLGQFLRRAGIRPTREILAGLFRRRERIFRAYFKRFIFPGAAGLLACLERSGYALGLVTGTPLHEVRRILPRGIRARFRQIVSGDQVKRGKPHPEPYRTACSRLAVAPRECVVVENAPYGIASAKRAGMFCIAVTTSLPREYLRQADAIVEGLERIPRMLRRLCEKRRDG